MLLPPPKGSGFPHLNNFMNKRKLCGLLVIPLLLGTLSGCSIIRNSKNAETEKLKTDDSFATNDSNELMDKAYYVWHDSKQKDLASDISVDTSKFKNYKNKIFTPVYKEGAVTGSTTDIGSGKRIFWMLAKNDDKIPTLRKGDELIFKSQEKLPDKLTLEHFYDHGVSVGIYGLYRNIDNIDQYIVKAQDGCGIKNGSTMSFAKGAFESDADEPPAVSIAKLGKQNITKDDVSKSGTIKGLKRNSWYEMEVYIGTKRYVKKVQADTRIFSSMEKSTFECEGYEFVKDGVMKIKLPEYLKTGYYSINDFGIFKYVNPEDGEKNKNESIIQYDDKGEETFNPAKKDEDAPDVEYSDYDSVQDKTSTLYRDVNITSDDEAFDKVSIKVAIGAKRDPDNKKKPTLYYAKIKEDGTIDKPKKIKTLKENVNKTITLEGLDVGLYRIILKNTNNYSDCDLSTSTFRIYEDGTRVDN